MIIFISFFGIVMTLIQITASGTPTLDGDTRAMADFVATVIGYIIIVLFCLGWLNIWGDPYYTWWGAIHYLGNL